MIKGFISVNLLPFTKTLGRSSYDVAMTHYDIIPRLFLFKFVTNAQDLQWDNFLVLTRNRRSYNDSNQNTKIFPLFRFNKCQEMLVL